MVQLIKKAKDGIGDIRLYWKKPPLGRYMSFKEIVSLSIGGMGVKFVTFCVQNMILAVGNTLIGNTIGIPPQPLYAIYLISILCSFPLTALRARLIDNSRSKKGKYRPFILSMGVPTAVLAVGFTLMPYDSMSMLWKCVTVLLFNIGFQFFYNFFYDAYESIINVLSPNTYERSDVCSIKTITDSFAPTIANIVIPLLARVITGENTLYDMRIYRAVYPPVIIGGFIIAMLIYFNTEEKIVQAKTHTVRMNFKDAFRAVAKNKYFWIISLAGWLGFLEGSFGNILGWLYNYQSSCSAGTYSLITAINGNASLWPMIFAPFIIRAIGKRNMLVYSNLLNIVFILAMFPIVRYGEPHKMIWMMLGCMFINNMATMLGHILNPSLNGDIRDYQQYITGERIDGMFVAVGLIGSIITLATSGVLPAIYKSAGLNETVALSLGYSASNVYDVLYNIDYFRDICGVLILASAVGATLNVIPFFFYDLTEIKQKAMVTVLKIRALFEDYGNNALSDADLVEAIDLIEEANRYVDEKPVTLSKDALKAAKKSKVKSDVKAAREAYKAGKLTNEKIAIAQYVVKEVTKFDTPEFIGEVARARLIVSDGLQGLATLSTVTLEDAKLMPKATKDEKTLRKAAIERARAEAQSKKLLNKYYPEGITEFDADVFEKLFAAEDDNEAQTNKAYSALAEAKKNKNREDIRRYSEEIKALKVKKAQIKGEIKKATTQNSIYNRAAKPYLDAKKLLIQQENYKHYEDIKQNYELSKERNDAERAKRLADDAREKAEKEEYARKLKEEKKASKGKK